MFGIEKDTARKASDICKRIESGMRIPDLTFTHHAIVAGRHDASELLELATSVDAAIERGEVRAEGCGKYQVGTSEIAKAEVDRWRKLAAIPDEERETPI